IDDEQAEKQGNWSKSASVAGFVGAEYLHDNNQEKGRLSATYRFAVKEPGMYEARVSYTPNANRATNVPVVVQYAEGEATLALNERIAPEIEKTFHSLGRFKADKQVVVVISNKGTDGYVVIDAVQLVPAGEK